jgi:3HB-oligomer hydrolase (3HBOH)
MGEAPACFFDLEESMLLRRCSISLAALTLLIPISAGAATRCDQVLHAFGTQLADATCFESTDLTTNNPLTTPLDNSIPGLPAFAFIPRTDRNILINAAVTPPEDKTPITMAVPGLQINAKIASDPTGQARFLLRLPDNWNGRLVVAGAPSQRSEFTNDYGWSDYVVQKGYAYASQNKGVLNFYVTTSADPLGCQLFAGSTTYVHFYDDDPGKPFTQWAQYMIDAANLARTGIKGAYGGGPPRYTYAVGTSNGGYQVRRAVELAPKLFDGGVDWEGTYVDERAPNILTDLPPGILNFPDYAASVYDANSTAAKNIRAAGYPPDIVNNAVTPASFWGRYNASYWEATMCQWQKRLDPSYDTYGSGLATYNYTGRLPFSDVGENMAAFATTGLIQAPLITVAGTMDALLPIDHHARAYARAVEAGREDDGHDNNNNDNGNGNGKRPAYRLYEVQNGNHIENYKAFYPQLEYILPHAQRAFDLLVASVEQRATLPPNQCIPRGGAITAAPAQPGHCANLFAP